VNAFVTFMALVGATILVTQARIVAPLRRLAPKFFGCAQCVGTWIGFAGGGSGLLPLGHGRVIDAILVGFATSVLSLLVAGVLLILLGEVNAD